MLLESGEIEKVTRYRRIGEDEKYPKYLVIYQFENQQAFERYEASSELAAAVEYARNSWPAGSYEPSWRVQYEFVSHWKR